MAFGSVNIGMHDKNGDTLLLHAPPDETTKGEVGQLALDTNNRVLYTCVIKTHAGGSVWEPVFAGGDITKELKMKNGQKIWFDDFEGNHVFFIMANEGHMFIGGPVPRSAAIITGVATPQYAMDAANKEYVDQQIHALRAEIAKLTR